MENLVQGQFSEILRRMVELLDIPDAMYEEAERKYHAVGEWLGASDSTLITFNPDIYPQGSFALGTVIRPITDKDEYDVDLVCQLQIAREHVSQQQLKNMVGNRLKANATYAKIIEEGRRCWTLQYADSARFHMDILPAIPDPRGLPKSILITDKELRQWQSSNPRGYAEWFRNQMRTIAEQERRALATNLRMDIAKVPDWRIKTPLQRSIQLLKRHRDFHFQNDQDDKPISIIITTLAAKSYRGEANLFQALKSMLERMPGCIEHREDGDWVPNPVNSKENFADKWREHPQRGDKFKKWLSKVQYDIASAIQKAGSGMDKVAEVLRPAFGTRTVNEALGKIGNTARQMREAGQAKMTPQGIITAAGSIPVKGHTFYGAAE